MSSLATDRLLAELVATRDGQRSGAVDVAWPGAHASLFFVFGQPSHATMTLDLGDTVEGPDALDRLLATLPSDACVAPWRRVMVTEDTLRLTVDELIQRLGDGVAPAPPPPPSLPVPVSVGEFPLLPLGVSLWSDAAANVVHLEMLAPKLPDSLVVLTADGVRAATVIAHGVIVDSVYVDATSCLLGDSATDALMRTTHGTVSGYGLDDERLLASIPLLWRSRRAVSGLPTSWIDVDRMASDIRETGLACALLVTGGTRGAALFHDGQLVGSYTEQRRIPTGSMSALRAMLRTPGATVTVLTESPSMPVERALAEEAFHQFIAMPPAEHDPSAVEGDPGADALLPDDHGTSDAVMDTVDGSDVAPEADAPSDGAVPSTHEPPLLAHFPPSVFTLPALDAPLAPNHRAAAHGWDDALEDVDATPLAGDDFATASTNGAAASTNGHVEAFDADIEPAADAVSEPEYVPARLEFDVAALRTELIDIATVWLGAADVGAVSRIIKRTRPGVDEFVGAVARIGALQVPGHEPAVVRAMAREMHYRVAEVLCAV